MRRKNVHRLTCNETDFVIVEHRCGRRKGMLFSADTLASFSRCVLETLNDSPGKIRNQGKPVRSLLVPSESFVQVKTQPLHNDIGANDEVQVRQRSN